MATVLWDRQKLKAFKKAFADAADMDELDFIFEGNLYLVTYARYLIEYLEGKLK